MCLTGSKLRSILVEMLRDAAVSYAEAWIGKPYVWGGDDFSGFDCSGFAIEVLQSVGILPHIFDDTADGLFNRYKSKIIQLHEAKPGCLVFWFRADSRASHVEVCRNERQVIGAGGGGAPQLTPEEIVREDAFLSALLPMPATIKTDSPFIYWLMKRGIYIKEAIERNAYVKVRPITYRGLQFKIVDPFAEG